MFHCIHTCCYGSWLMEKITQFRIFFSKKVNSFPNLLPKFHPIFLPAVHLLIKIKNFKSHLDFLKNLLKKSDLPKEHWFFLKTNTSIKINQQSVGKAGGYPHFLFPTASWKDHEEDKHKPKASPKLCCVSPTFLPSTRTSTHIRLVVSLNCATQPSTSGGN